MRWQDVNDILRFWEPGDPGSKAQQLFNSYNAQGIPITEWDYDLGGPDLIRQIIFNLYHQSATGLQVLENAVVNAEAAEQELPDGGLNRALWLFRTSENTSAILNSNSVAINLDATEKFYLGKDGLVKTFSIERTVVHELLHGVQGLEDLVKANQTGYEELEVRDYNDPTFDHLGLTVY